MMVSTEKTSLITSLYEACVDFLNKLSSDDINNEHIYAFTLHCMSGCDGVGVAISTRESIENLPSTKNPKENYDKHNYVNVAEWVYLGLHDELLYDVSEDMRKLSNDFFDEELEDVSFDEFSEKEFQEFYITFFIDVIIAVINKLKESESFNKPYFEKDLLLGALFSDPGEGDLEMMEKISEQVNSPYWHSKVKEYLSLF